MQLDINKYRKNETNMTLKKNYLCRLSDNALINAKFEGNVVKAVNEDFDEMVKIAQKGGKQFCMEPESIFRRVSNNGAQLNCNYQDIRYYLISKIKYALKQKDFTDDDIKIDYANDRIIVQWGVQW